MPSVRSPAEVARLCAEAETRVGRDVLASALVLLVALGELRTGAATPHPVAANTIVGTRPPLPAPSIAGKTEREARTWMRRHARELVPYGAVRSGGKSGRSVAWEVSQGALERFLADERAKRRRAAIVPVVVSPAEDDVDRWIAESGLRTTRRSA